MSRLTDLSLLISVAGLVLIGVSSRLGTKNPDRAKSVSFVGVVLVFGGIFLNQLLGYFERKERLAETLALLRAAVPPSGAQGEAAELVLQVQDGVAGLDITRLMILAVLFGLAVGMLIAHVTMTRRSPRSPVSVMS